MYDIGCFYKASSVDDAIKLLNSNKDAILISGGTDVLIKLRETDVEDCTLVSIHKLKELIGIEELCDGTIIIKSGTCFSHIAKDPIINKHIKALGEAADEVGSPQIRNVATIGGNICNGAVSADSVPMLMVCNAVLDFASCDGIVSIPINEFYTGPGKTVRKHSQILTAIKIKKSDYEDFGFHYTKYGLRNAMEIATIGCAIGVKLGVKEGIKIIKKLRISFSVAAPTPIRCPKTEALAINMPISSETLNIISNSVLQEVNPRTSFRASKEFRMQLIKELSYRTVESALKKAGGLAND